MAANKHRDGSKYGGKQLQLTATSCLQATASHYLPARPEVRGGIHAALLNWKLCKVLNKHDTVLICVFFSLAGLLDSVSS